MPHTYDMVPFFTCKNYIWFIIISHARSCDGTHGSDSIEKLHYSEGLLLSINVIFTNKEWNHCRESVTISVHDNNIYVELAEQKIAI